jgi:hypothetical protein
MRCATAAAEDEVLSANDVAAIEALASGYLSSPVTSRSTRPNISHSNSRDPHRIGRNHRRGSYSRCYRSRSTASPAARVSV